MKRKELKILGLSYSQSQLGSYVIVLTDKKGSRKLPMIIKPLEAQRIALELEGIKSPRPLTHDLFKSMGDSFGIDLQEVYIYSLVEGIFYTKLILSNGIEDIEVECTAGDAIALSVIYKCPIYTTQLILESAGVIINDDGTTPSNEDLYGDDEDLNDEDLDFLDMLDDELTPAKRVVSIEDLEKMMDEAINNEEYEIAATLRDRIQELKG
jgi:bifunctional DNase/RNase